MKRTGRIFIRAEFDGNREDFYFDTWKTAIKFMKERRKRKNKDEKAISFEIYFGPKY